MYEVSQEDWKKFKTLLPQWQEAYMERLCREYTELLQSEVPAEDRFWELDERIRKDRKKPGVFLEVSRSRILFHLEGLLCDGVIRREDLSSFSRELQNMMDIFSRVGNSDIAE